MEVLDLLSFLFNRSIEQSKYIYSFCYSLEEYFNVEVAIKNHHKFIPNSREDIDYLMSLPKEGWFSKNLPHYKRSLLLKRSF